MNSKASWIYRGYKLSLRSISAFKVLFQPSGAHTFLHRGDSSQEWTFCGIATQNPKEDKAAGEGRAMPHPTGPRTPLESSLDVREQPPLPQRTWNVPSTRERPQAAACCLLTAGQGCSGVPLQLPWPCTAPLQPPLGALEGFPRLPAAGGTGTRASRQPGRAERCCRGRASSGLEAASPRSGRVQEGEGARGWSCGGGPGAAAGGSPPGAAPCPRPGGPSGRYWGAALALGLRDRRCRRGPGAAPARAGSAPAARRSQPGTGARIPPAATAGGGGWGWAERCGERRRLQVGGGGGEPRGEPPQRRRRRARIGSRRPAEPGRVERKVFPPGGRRWRGGAGEEAGRDARAARCRLVCRAALRGWDVRAGMRAEARPQEPRFGAVRGDLTLPEPGTGNLEP